MLFNVRVNGLVRCRSIRRRQFEGGSSVHFVRQVVVSRRLVNDRYLGGCVRGVCRVGGLGMDRRDCVDVLFGLCSIGIMHLHGFSLHLCNVLNMLLTMLIGRCIVKILLIPMYGCGTVLNRWCWCIVIHGMCCITLFR